MIVLYIKYTVNPCAMKGCARASFLYILIFRFRIEARTPFLPFSWVATPNIPVPHDGCVRVFAMQLYKQRPQRYLLSLRSIINRLSPTINAAHISNINSGCVITVYPIAHIFKVEQMMHNSVFSHYSMIPRIFPTSRLKFSKKFLDSPLLRRSGTMNKNSFYFSHFT